MAAFRFYSIKLLPVSGKREDLVGENGYKKLFTSLTNSIVEAHKNNKVVEQAYSLRNEFYLSFLNAHPAEKYCMGEMIKFDSPENLVNTFSGATVQEIPKGTSAHRYEFFFVFDYEKHIFAIQTKAGRLPSSAIFSSALSHFIEPIARDLYPEHALKVDQLTSDQALKNVFDTAELYKRVEVSISLSNTDEYIDDEVNATEKELEELGVTEVEHTEKAAGAGLMAGMSKKCRHYLIIAKKNGNATIRYMENKTNKMVTFVMRENPLQLIVRRRRKISDAEYAAEVQNAIASANEKALKAE